MSEQNNQPLPKAPRTTTDKLLTHRAAEEAARQKILENQAEFKKALNAIASSEYGEFVFKTIVKALGVFTPKSGLDGIALIEVNTKRNFYLEFIRPYLEPSIRQKIEE